MLQNHQPNSTLLPASYQILCDHTWVINKQQESLLASAMHQAHTSSIAMTNVDDILGEMPLKT
jgi:hypothetical protein